MRLTIKTLQQQIFEVEVEPSETVEVLKEKIKTAKGDAFPVAGQKLIYAGKILENGKTLEHYNIDPSKFIVAMVTKPKQTPASAAKPEEAKTSTTAAPRSSEAPTSAVSSSTASTTTATTTAATPSEQPTPAAPQAEANPQAALVTNENYEETVLNIMAFGYPRDQVEAALAACFNNPDRAVDYLEGGEAMMDEMLGSQAQTPSVPSAERAGENPAAAGGATTALQRRANPASGGGMREMIQNNPQLQQMVEQVRGNPEILQMYMQQMSQQNPELLRFISEHQSEFVNFINNSSATDNPVAGAPRQPGVISVTPEERDEIEQLKAMGFQEHECIEAYIACNKNVELAVNFLLSGADM